MNNQEMIEDIIEQLERVKFSQGDISDVGNNIGIAIGKYIQYGDDKEAFIHGINHGISLIDGTH